MGSHSHHHHHHHHHMADNSTVGSLSTVSPTTATAIVQAVLTTVMSHAMHHEPEMAANGSHHGSSAISHIQEHHNEKSLTVDHSLYFSGDHSSADHMTMYFHFGVDAIILFKEWNISSTEGMIGSVIGIFLMAMLYEGIKFFREYMFKKYFTSLEYSSVSVLGDDGRSVTEVHKVARNRMFSWPHTVQTVLHIVQMVLSYFLMLIFMTYNVWLCLAVVFGAGTGYFLFGWKKATVVDITEHCH